MPGKGMGYCSKRGGKLVVELTEKAGIFKIELENRARKTSFIAGPGWVLVGQ